MNYTIDKIVKLPRMFNSSKNEKSAYELLSESGYFENFETIDFNNIVNILKHNIYLINDWLIWSENKRTNSGWYFLKKNEKYYVGFLNSNSEIINESEYCDEVLACATFIKEEIENIRNS